MNTTIYRTMDERYRRLMRYSYLVCFLLYTALLGAQDFETKDYVYVTNIKSVKLHPKGLPLLFPAIRLNTGRMTLVFDDLDNEYKDYTYDIIHCDRDWNPSDIDKIEYLQGFRNEELRTYTPSRATFVPYINYYLTIPNDDLNITKSGNYLLVVYEGDKEDGIVAITKRFIVFEDKVNLFLEEVKQSYLTDAGYQQFDLDIVPEKIRISRPLRDITVTLLQNDRWDQSLTKSPKAVFSDRIVVDDVGGIKFLGLNEYRNLDLRTFEFMKRGIEEISREKNGTLVTKDIELSNRLSNYISEPDLNGKYIIVDIDGNKILNDRDTINYSRNLDSSNDVPEAEYSNDYADVVFRLAHDPGYDIYVMGEFSDYSPESMYKMIYSPEEEVYKLTLRLKQGYYNYMYAIVGEDGKVDHQSMEGSHYDTKNRYNMIVYYREFGARYDRIIGYSAASIADLR